MNIEAYINSGILEMYILGLANESECQEVEKLRLQYPEIASEMEKIEISLEKYAQESSVTPHASLKPLVLATFDYMKRMEAGEEPTSPPVLSEKSRIEDYAAWVNRPDMVPTEDFDDIYAKILSATPEMTCAIVWIKEKADDEVHDKEYEHFLILEGTCTIVVGTEQNYLKAGDYFAVPLYESHQVIVTSSMPCKVLLQRIAA